MRDNGGREIIVVFSTLSISHFMCAASIPAASVSSEREFSAGGREQSMITARSWNRKLLMHLYSFTDWLLVTLSAVIHLFTDDWRDDPKEDCQNCAFTVLKSVFFIYLILVNVICHFNCATLYVLLANKYVFCPFLNCPIYICWSEDCETVPTYIIAVPLLIRLCRRDDVQKWMSADSHRPGTEELVR